MIGGSPIIQIHVNIWGKNVPGGGNSKYKVLETGTSLVCLKSNTEASVAGVR